MVRSYPSQNLLWGLEEGVVAVLLPNPEPLNWLRTAAEAALVAICR